MGTRNLTIVKEDGKYKLAQYGQWDGYPSGQGIRILNFLKNMDRDLFIKNLNELKVISSEEKEKLYNKHKENLYKLYPELTRDTVGEILQLIQDGAITYFDDDLAFIEDSLFCEWVYVIDFDTNTFEVFKGFNKIPLKEKDRFFVFQELSKEYYPCKLFKKYSLNKLPSEKQFLKLEKEEE